MKTLQIATVGENTDLVLAGVRNFPAHKVALICLARHKRVVDRFALRLKQVLKIPIDVYVVSDTAGLFEKMLSIVAGILRKDGGEFMDIMVNVAGGRKVLTCAAISAAFMNGLKAYHFVGETPVMLPILKLSYNEVVSDTKIDILRAIEKAGGEVDSLQELKKISGYGKPLLSHHIQGSERSRGLTELGLVETERVTRGRVRVKLTTVGKMFLLSTTGSTPPEAQKKKRKSRRDEVQQARKK